MNRRERRKLEKQFGLLKQYKNASPKEKAEIRARRREMGKKLHEQHLERIENSLREQREATEARVIQSWIAKGKTEEEAKEILNKNYEIQEKRRLDLEERDRQRKLRKKLKV